MGDFFSAAWEMWSWWMWPAFGAIGCGLLLACIAWEVSSDKEKDMDGSEFIIGPSLLFGPLTFLGACLYVFAILYSERKKIFKSKGFEYAVYFLPVACLGLLWLL